MLSGGSAAAPGGTGIALGYYQVAFPDDLSGLADYEAATGRPAAIVHWYALWGGWKSAFSATDLTAVSEHGSIPMITWEPWAGVPADPEWSLATAILSGANDGYIDTWARGLAAYGNPVLLRFAHEMHDQPAYPWAVGVNGNTAADYVAAWKHVRAIFARYGTQNVQWIWNPSDLGEAPPDVYAEKYSAVFPGDDQVDWLGLDVFNTGSDLDWGMPRWRSFAAALAGPYAALSRLSDRPLILAEVGSAESGGSKSAWIEQALSTDIAAFARVRGLVWFDVDKEEHWRLHSSPQAVAAWKSGTSQPRFDVPQSWPGD